MQEEEALCDGAEEEDERERAVLSYLRDGLADDAEEARKRSIPPSLSASAAAAGDLLTLMADHWDEIVGAAFRTPRLSNSAALPEVPCAKPRSSWGDIVDMEVGIVTHVLSMLSWAPFCAFRCCHVAVAQAVEVVAAHPVASTELCWVRVPERWHANCLRFIAQLRCNTRQLMVTESSRFDERLLLRLVCSMRRLESLEVDASPFGGRFVDPQRLFDRLAKYCPRLQHLSITLRHECPSERQTLGLRTLALLGRRLVSLDLGGIPVRVTGGSKTLAACCPNLERISAQLCQQLSRRLDTLDPTDLAKGCSRLNDVDLAPVDWDDRLLKEFTASVGSLQGIALRQAAVGASDSLLMPLLAHTNLLSLHLALHARTERDRARSWLVTVGQLTSLRSLCLDYAAPLGLGEIVSTLFGNRTTFSAEFCGNASLSKGLSCLAVLTVHGCNVDDDAVHAIATACPQLEQLRAFPDSWRQLGEITNDGFRHLLQSLPRLRGLAIGSKHPLQADKHGESWRSLRSMSVFAPLDDDFCRGAEHWRCIRRLWLGPHRIMQKGVTTDSSISDVGVELVAAQCPELTDLTVVSVCITDVGVAATLRSCRELRRLRLGGRGITDDSLILLEELSQPRLERFSLWFAGVSVEGVRRAEEEMPWTYFDIEVQTML
eukprot:TRINITY_DN61191_c0_g1_i1.p1 TRINITY_DN61191_c0_g1~~TRINITY_DN61191_c0_g1_i1.p1  ORF type:complete len:660 (+),score=104.91 TRINITY_DN61191_c0_g1_i1:149-2128(+)